MPEDREPDQEPEPSDQPDQGDERLAQHALGAALVGLEMTRVFNPIRMSEAWSIVQKAQAVQTSTLVGKWLKSPVFNLVDTEKIMRPFLPDLTKWIGDASGYSRSIGLMAETIAAPAAKLWAQLAPTFELLKGHWLPANLREIDDLDIEDLVSVADDGITLYTVPRAAIAKRILAAPDKTARRRILGRELPRILDDCDAMLDQCGRPDTKGAVVFARKSIAAARAGHTEAAQALVANTLDTVRAQTVEHADRALIQGHKRASREDLDDLSVRRFMVFAPIWQAYSSYTPGQVAPIPSTFNRHVNAHGVNVHQFSRPNMAQGAMLLTGLIALLNDL